MTHEFKNVSMFLFGAMFFLVACQNDAVQEIVNENVSLEIASKETAYTTKVSVDDAKRVANLFNRTSNDSRALKAIKEIKVVKDENGKPSMYVVNFANNQGFVLVSATRNFLPILVYNNEGNFTIPDENINGLSLWLEKTKQNVKIADALPTDSTAKFRSEWKKYEEQVGFNPKESRSTNSELDQYVIQMTSQWQQDNVEWCSLEDAQDFLPTSQYQAWSELVAGAIDPSYQDVNPLTYSFVVTEFTDYGSGAVNNFIHTNWNQLNGYNASILAAGKGPHAGCTTIAMAQIMKYYGYPTNKSWNDMPNNNATTTTANFIHEVANTIGVTYYSNVTTAEIEQVRNAFNTYGYYNEIEEHDINSVINELENGRPVFMIGYPSYYETGHAWIASGCAVSRFQKNYLLYVPVQNMSMGNPYLNIETCFAEASNSAYFYMNWGQDIVHTANGYYNDYDLTLPNWNNFNYLRHNLINIEPIN